MVIYEILLKLVYDETFEDAKAVIRNGKSKVRQVNGQTKKTNSDIQNISQKSKDRVKYGGDLGFY